MDLKLKGKTTLDTELASGIGYALALGLAKEGVKVVFNGRSQEKLDKAAETIREQI